MYRPSMAAWYQSLVHRLPLKAIPTTEQRQIAKTFTHQPEVPWCSLSLDTVHALVYAQAHEAKSSVDDRLTHELMAALTWRREIIVPDAQRVREILRTGKAPGGALPQLARLRQQTTYVLIEQPLPSEQSAFLNGVWLMYNCSPEGEQRIILLMDLLIKGEPVREVVVEFGCDLELETAVEREVERVARTLNWDIAPGAIALRENMREYYRTALPVVAVLHDTLIVHADEISMRRQSAEPDELGFTLLALGSQGALMHALAAGTLH